MTVLGAVANDTAHLAQIFGPTTAGAIQAWDGVFLNIGTALLTILHGYSSNAPGILTKGADGGPVAKVILFWMTWALIVTGLLLSYGVRANAADAPRAQPILTQQDWSQGYTGEGFFVGLGFESGPVQVGTGGTQLALGAGPIVGYSKGFGTWVGQIETDWFLSGYGASGGAGSLTGPARLSQWVKVGGPLSNYLGLLGVPSMPSFPGLPPVAGVTVVATTVYAAIGVEEDDISFNYAGLKLGQEWQIAPAARIGTITKMSDGIALDAYTKYIAPESGSRCFGPAFQACGGTGQTILGGLNLVW
jgi:hypothetical protein